MKHWKFMGISMVVLALVATSALAQSGTKKDDAPATPAGDMEIYTGGTPDAEAIGWRVGCQAYSFNRFSFFEAVDKSAQMGLTWIEAYPGQRLSPEMDKDVKFHHDMSKELQKTALAYLKSKGVTVVNYGVVGLGSEEAGARKVFDFCKAMGIETICSEPDYDTLDMVEKLADEYKINIAIHNHPKPSKYWDYKTVLEQCEGRSARIGACADTGHWMRSGICPLEAVTALKGRIISMHLKDLNEFGVKSAHDTVWGQGKANMCAILCALKCQGFKGVISAEYEHNWDNSVPEISQCMKYLNETAKKMKDCGKDGKCCGACMSCDGKAAKCAGSTSKSDTNAKCCPSTAKKDTDAKCCPSTAKKDTDAKCCGTCGGDKDKDSEGHDGDDDDAEGSRSKRRHN